jgi:ABC-type multidrug transport system ATPase subunit
MDEADKLCDRIAIVDHGQLVALDTQLKLKDSVPAVDIVEAEFENPPADWTATLEKMNGVASVAVNADFTHISTTSGPLTVRELMDTARDRGVNVRRVRTARFGARHDARRRLPLLHWKATARCRFRHREARYEPHLQINNRKFEEASKHA